MQEAPAYPPSSPLRRGYTLALLTLLSALAFMDRQILAVLLQPVKAEFGLSDLAIGLITGLGFSLTFVLLGIPLGKLADRGQRRSVLVFSRGVGALLGAAGALATGFWSLLVSRAGSALSDAGGAPASIAMLSDLYPPERRSRVISVFGTGASVGALLSLVLGAWLAQHYGWRVTMAVIGASALLFVALLYATVREPVHALRAQGAAQQRHGALRELARNRVALWLILGSGFTLLAAYSFGAWNTALLIRRHGLSLQAAGWISGAAALASITGALWSGHFTDWMCRRDQRWQLGVPLLGMVLALPCGLAYLAMPVGSVWVASALLLVYAFFVVWWAAPVYAALSFVVPAQRRATAHAVIMLVGSVVGSGLGPILTGWLSDRLDTGLAGDGLRFALMAMIGMLVPGALAFARALPAYPALRQALLQQAAAVPRSCT